MLVNSLMPEIETTLARMLKKESPFFKYANRVATGAGGLGAAMAKRAEGVGLDRADMVVSRRSVVLENAASWRPFHSRASPWNLECDGCLGRPILCLYASILLGY